MNLHASWAALSRPSIKRASAREKESLALADASAMDGRVKPGHDERMLESKR